MAMSDYSILLFSLEHLKPILQIAQPHSARIE